MSKKKQHKSKAEIEIDKKTVEQLKEELMKRGICYWFNDVPDECLGSVIENMKRMLKNKE